MEPEITFLIIGGIGVAVIAVALIVNSIRNGGGIGPDNSSSGGFGGGGSTSPPASSHQKKVESEKPAVTPTGDTEESSEEEGALRPTAAKEIEKLETKLIQTGAKTEAMESL